MTLDDKDPKHVPEYIVNPNPVSVGIKTDLIGKADSQSSIDENEIGDRLDQLTEIERYLLFLIAANCDTYNPLSPADTHIFLRFLEKIQPVSRETDFFFRHVSPVRVNATVNSLINNGWSIKKRNGGYYYSEYSEKSLLNHHLKKTYGISYKIYHATEQWEETLKELNYMLSLTGKEEPPVDPEEQLERLAWFLDYDPEKQALKVTPKFQRRLKSEEKWSKGAPATNSSEFGPFELMIQNPCLTRQDVIALCTANGTLSRDVQFHGNAPLLSSISEANKARFMNGLYYGNSFEKCSYHFGEDVICALVGHPAIYLENQPNEPIELVVEEPSITVEQTPTEFLVYPSFVKILSQKPYGRYGAFCKAMDNINEQCLAIQESGDRFRIFPLGAAKEIFNLFECSGKKFPKNAFPQLERILAKIPLQIRFESETPIILAGVEEQPCDTRLCLILLPLEEDRFILEMRVYPFGKAGIALPPCCGAMTMTATVLGRKIQTERNFSHEKMLVDHVLAACPSLLNAPNDGRGSYSLDSLEQTLQFLCEFRTARFREVDLLQPKGFIQVSSIASFENLRLAMKEVKEWFEVSGTFEVDERQIDFRKLLDVIDLNKSKRLVKMGERDYIALSEELLRRLDDLKRLTQDDEQITVSPFAATLLDDFFDQVPSLRTSELWKDVKKRLADSTQLDPVLPPEFVGTLRDYQMKGFRWMVQMANWGVGVCLADDMGLGKTIQGLALLLSRKKLGPALIVAPTSVVTNWVREVKRFAPALNVLKVQAISSQNGGAHAARLNAIESAKAGDLLITTYGLMTQEIAAFSRKRFATIILDESQAIKNASSQRAQAAYELQGDFRIAMSGTPIENRLPELWSLFQFLNPGFFPSSSAFDDKFSFPIQKEGSEEAGSTLRRLVQPFILRRTKGEVLKELPARTEIVLEVDLSPEERVFYESVRKEALLSLTSYDSNRPGQIDILAAFTRLRQICCNTKLLNIESQISSAKMDTFLTFALDLMENHHKTLVFSQFTKHLRLVAKELDERDISYQYFDGDMPAGQRQNAIDAFQAGEGDFFLISLKAGGVGLNLTAADYVIHLDPWWNPAVEDQATDRAHRIGQTKPVTVYRLITKDTIEEKIAELHLEKRDLAQKILEGTDQIASLSTEELLNLLRE